MTEQIEARIAKALDEISPQILGMQIDDETMRMVKDQVEAALSEAWRNGEFPMDPFVSGKVNVYRSPNKPSQIEVCYTPEAKIHPITDERLSEGPKPISPEPRQPLRRVPP